MRPLRKSRATKPEGKLPWDGHDESVWQTFGKSTFKRQLSNYGFTYARVAATGIDVSFPKQLSHLPVSKAWEALAQLGQNRRRRRD